MPGTVLIIPALGRPKQEDPWVQISGIAYSVSSRLLKNLVSKAVDGIAEDDVRDCPLLTSHASVRASS